ncbi:MAG: hypothetical protein GF331_06670 [Chitinivibrionales bacterium]|nr:hypothetical protein [Chitinivibrionales bacterium]
MSIVVAVEKDGRVAMAADTQTSFGDVKVPPDNLRTCKINKLGSSYIGKTGWGLYDNIFSDFVDAKKAPSLLDETAIYTFFLRLWRRLHERYGFVNDQCRDKDSPFGDLDASFLITNKNGIFHVASDMSVTRFAKYYAIGDGNDFALGALYSLYNFDYDAETLAAKAVEAAMAFRIFCGGEIDTVVTRRARTSR